MFLMLVKGPRGIDHFQHSITDFGTHSASAASGQSQGGKTDPIQTMATEMQDLRRSLARNPLLRGLEWADIPKRWPGLYHFALGMSYDAFRGTIKMLPILFAMVCLVVIVFAGRIPHIPWWAWSLAHFWTMQNIFEPAQPLLLDAKVPSKS